jgi:hypothetical protein
MRRNGHLIKSKRAVKFEVKRAEWCTYQNFKMMYNEVYKEMVKGGIAKQLEGEDGQEDGVCLGSPNTIHDGTS